MEKEKHSQYSLAVNKSPRFLSSGARSTILNRLAFRKFQRFLGNISSFQQIVQKKVVECPWYESSKRYKNAASRHVMYVISRSQRFRVFLSGESFYIRGLISQNAGTVPEFSNFHFSFVTSVETDFLVSTLIQPFTFPSLRFEYSVSVLEMPTRELVERVVCFRSFLLLGKRNNFLLMIGGRAN